MSDYDFETFLRNLRETFGKEGDARLKRMLISGQAEMLFEWGRWREAIPYLEFPSHWQIRIVPPFTGAIVRFYVRTKDMAPDDRVSVYLDCYDQLGSFGQPYWEIYPAKDGSIARVPMADTSVLLAEIEAALRTSENK